jgi:chemotaxis protein MotB
VLFDSGKAEIKAGGKEALGQVAAALAAFEGRRFQVAGHTDNVPIRHSGFISNWQLSADRALEVVNFMIQEGMKPEALSAAGYGEYDPVADNGSAEGKAKNRRIEITLQPNIDDFVAVPAAEGG